MFTNMLQMVNFTIISIIIDCGLMNEHTESVGLYNTIGEIYYDQGYYKEAHDAFKKGKSKTDSNYSIEYSYCGFNNRYYEDCINLTLSH